MVATEREWTWDEFGRLPFETVPCDIHCVTKWSKLGTSFGGVSVDTLLEAAEPLGAYAMAYSHGGYTTNLAIEDLTDGKAGSSPSTRASRSRASTAARHAARPAPLLLEERQVGCRAADHGPRRARLLGGRTATTTAATPGGGALLERLTPAFRGRAARARAGGRSPPCRRSSGDAAGEVVSPRAADVDAAPAGPALRRPPHRPGRLPGPALLLDRLVTARRGRDRADDRPARRRRGLPVLPRRGVEGDQVEVRGPFASYFVWRGEAPVLLVGGGSGVVPLMAMLRHRRRTMPELAMRLVYSVRSAEDVIYADELGDDAVLTFTRSLRGLDGPHRAIDAELIAARRLERRHRLRVRLERVRRDRRRSCCSRPASSRSGSAPSASGRPADYA